MNPGDLAWRLAWLAADGVIDRANLGVSLGDVRRHATHALAKSFLPAVAIAVVNGATRFPVVRDDDTDEEAAIIQEWATEVVLRTIAALDKFQTDEVKANLPPDVIRDLDAGNF